MIIEMKPLTIVETEKMVKEHEGDENLQPYFKKFVKVKLKDVEPMKKELEGLNNHKIKNEHIVKIIDMLPKDASDIHKIFIDISLDENEIKQINEIVAKYK
ncbi:hypothetical protein COU53_03195 [Candidatus Pacearchaeota archaeon CG10_big_fil_rev_8_21_14_0_10_30_48]|nr:MAG: hypothetical protein COU53_03195 [Candidatus Pacearchaeota archaeon CG10_big_fil_rev_8_21_14_0_10_30_48]